jgi:hypothetical protein
MADVTAVSEYLGRKRCPRCLSAVPGGAVPRRLPDRCAAIDPRGGRPAWCGRGQPGDVLCAPGAGV